MRKKIFLTLKAALLIAAVYIAGEIILSKYGLTVTSYEVKIQEPFRIVQLTDLHNMSFGKDNSRLIKNIEEQDPDLICMAGDMLNRDEQSLEVVTGLISRLSEKYRVFFSLGNHETAYEENFGVELKDELERAGAVVLNNEYREIRLNEETVYIGGISSYGLIEPAGMLLWRGLGSGGKSFPRFHNIPELVTVDVK